MSMTHQLAASILSANFACLGQEVERVLEAGCDRIHFDVMDNHYVPNLTVGAMVCKALRRYGIKAPIDVHLMVQPVNDLIRRFAEAGATTITIHPEASDDVGQSLALIRECGSGAGLAFNPGMALDALDGCLVLLDTVLIMSVHPGFSGQAFIPETLDAVVQARARIDKSGRNILLGIDGGIKVENAAQVATAGANVLVSGSGIFGASDYKARVSEFRKALQ